MRKSLLSLAKKCTAAVIGVAGLVGSASAVVTNTNTATINGFNQATKLELNPNGLGHILVVPYFTVNGGNDTYLSINNTDMRNGKAVKVRFRGAGNSDDIFDFTVLLSPGDIWTAAVSKDAASGLSKLTTTDKSCTIPASVGKTTGSFVLFNTNRLPAGTAASATNEGYVEIFNMADIPPVVFANTLPTTTTNALFTAIKHVNGTPPCTPATFTTLNPTTNAGIGVGGFQTVDTTEVNYGTFEALGFTNPTTGLKANWTVINVPRSTVFTGAAVAVEARDANSQPGVGNIVFYPQTADAVTLANARLATADPLLRGGIVSMPIATTTGTPGAAPVAAAMYDFPDLSTPYIRSDLLAAANGVGTKRQAFALTNALAVSSVANEFVTEPSILAATDWVFSLPTRRYNVARDYSGTGSNLFTNLARDDQAASAAVTNTVTFGVNVLAATNQWNFFAAENTSTNSNYPNIICVTGVSGAAGSQGTPTLRLTSGQTGDREEVFLAASADFVVSPGVPGATFSLCGEVAVFSFSDTNTTAQGSKVLGAALTRFNADVPYTAGWSRISTPGLTVAGAGLASVTTGGIAAAGNGLPVIGFSAIRLQNNAAAPGIAATYGLSYPHSRTPFAGQ